MKIKNILWLFVLISALSCKSRQTENQANDFNYMQNIEQIATETSSKNAASAIQPGDHIVIVVSGKDMDVVKPFNQNWSSSEAITNIQSGGNSAVQPQNVSGPTYIVDSEGRIDFPIIGTLDTTGKSMEDFKSDLRGRLSKYLINPVVSMRLTNYKVTVLGEVNRPGQYIIPDGQTTLLSALGLAGDLTLYGRRDDILLVRNENGQITKQRVNITDASFISSPYYNLKQGDVIYVSANKNREQTSKQNPNTNLYISIASVALGLLGVLVSVLKK